MKLEMGSKMLPGLVALSDALADLDAEGLGEDLGELLGVVSAHMPEIVALLGFILGAVGGTVEGAAGFKEGAVSAGQGEFPQLTGDASTDIGSVAGWLAASPAFVAAAATGGATSRHLTAEGKARAAEAEDAAARERWLELAGTIPGLERHAEALIARSREPIQVVVHGDIIAKQGFEDRVVEIVETNERDNPRAR